MKQQALVSVIVAVKDETDLLRRCLRSLLRQSWKQTEIIVVNDGSGPETTMVLQEFDEKNITVLQNEIPLGQSLARNLAIEKSRGDFIAIADADDDYHPHRLEAQITYFLSQPETGILGSGFYTENGKSWELYESDAEIKCQLLINNPLIHSAVMMRRQVAEQWKYRDAYNTAEDYDLWCRAAAEIRMANLPDKLVTYRIGQKSTEAVEDQRMKARKIRENYLHMNCREFPQKLVPDFHEFCELRAGLNASQILDLIGQTGQSNRILNRKALDKILYRQFALYAGKHRLRMSTGLKLKLVQKMDTETIQGIRFFVKSLFF